MIVKLLHEGETTTQLKNVIRYNTVDKEYLNSITNPRLLQPVSNLGIIDIEDKSAYQDFMLEFISEINLNKSLSTNKRQKKLYAHEVISFEDEDNKNYTQDELIKIAIETLNNLYDMDNTPYVLYPQLDSGRLHFHIIRSEFNNIGAYQRVKNSKLKMRQSCEKIELKYNLTLTGNNVSDEIRPANDPMLKVFKNRQLEAEYHHQKNISEAIKQDTPIGNIKRKTYNLLMNDSYQNQVELAQQQAYQATQQTIDEKAKINDELETIKNNIFTIYKESKDETDFIKAIESQDISIELLKHSKTGTNKGIVFHHNEQAISGGKISNSMTLGKIKKRFPNFVHSLEKPPVLHSTARSQKSLMNFHIEQINKYYKQRKNNNNNDILIYFGMKNVEARPYNYNLKLSSNRDSIRFGPTTPNDHDLILCIDVALESGWQGATLSNSSPEFLKRMMKAAYQKDPELLFFVKSDKSNKLSYADLKEIKGDLLFDELRTAIRNDLIEKSDVSILIDEMQKQAITTEEVAFCKALKRGYPITELDKKTLQELQIFNHHNTFEPIKNEAKKITHHMKIIVEEGRESVQTEIQKEIEEMEMLPKDLLEKAGYKAKNRIS